MKSRRRRRVCRYERMAPPLLQRCGPSSPFDLNVRKHFRFVDFEYIEQSSTFFVLSLSGNYSSAI